MEKKEDCEVGTVSFSVIVVCLNPGEKIKKTLDSVQKQTYPNYEVVVKDGGSGDDTESYVEALAVQDSRIRLYVQKDHGIYDAMNQALGLARKEYVLFLNCGDAFHDDTVLGQAAKVIAGSPGRGIYYGDTFCEQIGQRVASPPEITPFVCYRNIPCHQSCFYESRLICRKPFELRFRIRADYEQFFWCCAEGGAVPLCMNLVVSDYEGGGYSESRENRRQAKQEHREITRRYLTVGQRFRYRLFLVVTLAPLRRLLAESRLFSGMYHKIKTRIYR